jgi:hypothetical protein
MLTEIAVANGTNDLVCNHLRARTQSTKYGLQSILVQNALNCLLRGVYAILLSVARHEAIMNISTCNNIHRSASCLPQADCPWLDRCGVKLFQIGAKDQVFTNIRNTVL